MGKQRMKKALITGITGQDGSYLAEFLLEKGYEIRHRNWHSGHRDLDIVAQKDGELVIVEVKTRSDACFGQPEDAVDRRKIRSIVASTDA